ncbi:MAG TPA: hypothetical protein PKC39_00780 [Ferruginibacter sp.]|nr:hypothetical protein [Ferruginibacter sp.]HMP19466.1 hypothetical protein [Ferruginibacter sp.]
MPLFIKQQAASFNRFIVLLCSIGMLFCSCKKDSFITSPDARLVLSADTLKYDTVFASIGSITQAFKINNANNRKLLINTVKLMGGAASEYNINVNGIAARQVNDIEVAANDSIYVFVTVNINPTAAALPFIVRDSIEITYNGNTRYVQLEAFGQNAHFLRNKVIESNTTWVNDLPYVILGGIQIDTGITLTINPGCKIYCNASAPVLVDGTLIVNGTFEEPVTFTGDRLDDYYRDFPASWPGIYFRQTSKNNVVQFATVKNAYQALAVQGAPDNLNPKLILAQSVIDNAYDAGIICVNTTVYAENNLISNCGNNINILLGGAYAFTHCTVASYPTYIPHQKPVLSATNFAEINGSMVTTGLNATFTNCIFWGEGGIVKNEIDIKRQGSDAFTVQFDHCLYKAETIPANAQFTNSIQNQYPAFDSIDASKRFFDFRTSLAANAPGVDKGNPITALSLDLDNRQRTDGKPDIGCYEKP